MAKIAVEEDYAASAAVVWKKLADFGGLGTARRKRGSDERGQRDGGSNLGGGKIENR